MTRNLMHVVDGAVLALVGAVVGVGIALRADDDVRPLALALGLAAAAVLAARRRAPGPTLVATGALALGVFALDRGAGAIAAIAPAVALYSLALSRGRIHVVLSVVAAGVAVAAADAFLVGHQAHALTLQTAGHVALVAIPVLAAEALRNRRAYVRLLLERLAVAEREREEEARRRAEQERIRIARELHDVVAHTLTTINVQAGVAAHLLDRDPEHAKDALAAIETGSHAALDELRAILGVLRETRDGAPPLEPAPDLAAVAALVEQVRATGTPVELRVDGEPPERVPEVVQLAGFRIVQESLTNARRHATGTPVCVTLSYRPDHLRLTIDNTIPAGTNGDDGATGVGIVGMRERATALGGTFEARRTDDRFRVAADLPYRRT